MLDEGKVELEPNEEGPLVTLDEVDTTLELELLMGVEDPGVEIPGEDDNDGIGVLDMTLELELELELLIGVEVEDMMTLGEGTGTDALDRLIKLMGRPDAELLVLVVTILLELKPLGSMPLILEADIAVELTIKPLDARLNTAYTRNALGRPQSCVGSPEQGTSEPPD